MKQSAFLLFSVLLLNLSCSNKEVPLYPTGERSVVLHTMLRPKEPIVLSLNYTKPLESVSQPSGSNVIRSAQVFLYEDGMLVDTLRYQDLYYQSKISGSLQTTYKVEASIPGQKGLVKAETKIPIPADIQITKLDSIYRDGQSFTRVMLRVKDPLDRIYYDVRVERYIFVDSSSSVRTVVPILASSPGFEFLQGELSVISGADVRGENNIVELYTPRFTDERVKDSLVVNFISINEDFHDFLLANTRQSDNTLTAGYDRTFTNVENGIGIFTGSSFAKTYYVW